MPLQHPAAAPFPESVLMHVPLAGGPCQTSQRCSNLCRGVFDGRANDVRSKSRRRVQLWKSMQPSALSTAVSHMAQVRHCSYACQACRSAPGLVAEKLGAAALTISSTALLGLPPACWSHCSGGSCCNGQVLNGS